MKAPKHDSQKEGLRLLKRRLICCTAYADSRELKAAIKKFRNVNDTSKHPVHDMILAHECGHATVGLHHNIPLQAIVIEPKAPLNGIEASGGCVFCLNGTESKTAHLQMLVAGVVAGFVYCGSVFGENIAAKEKLFDHNTDAAKICDLLYERITKRQTRECDTALHQIAMGLRVTAHLSKRNIEKLRQVVQSAKEILLTHESKFKALAQALWDNRDKAPDSHARLSQEEITDIWTKKKENV